MSAPFTAAAIQFEPTMFAKERNVEALLRLVREAADAGARLIVTPEMGTTGYCWHDRAEIAPFVEPIPGPTTDRFASLAKETGCTIVVGLPEVDPTTDFYYNSAVLIGPDGIVGTHRKTHPYISEPKWAVSGDLGHQVFETPIGRICLLICMDIHFIETARIAGLRGADVICHVSNWLAERTPAPYWISRAFENGCYLIEANRWGLERGVQFSGGSCIIAPDATILDAVDSGDGIAYAQIDPAIARARTVWGEPILAQRRPDLYMELMTNTFAWNPGDFFRLYDHKPLPHAGTARIAVAQMAPGDEIDANIATIERISQAAARAGADLVVFPARALTGLASPRQTAIPLDDPSIGALTALARRTGLHLLVGFAEREAGRHFDSAVLATPGGVLGVYRKIHLTKDDERWASAGDDWAVFDLPFGRLGVLIGHDLTFPEAGRILALKGCDLVACPSATRDRFHLPHEGTGIAQPAPIPTGADPLHWHQYRVRAGENNCWLAFANVYAPQDGYLGLSGVFGPDTFLFPRQEEMVADGGDLAVATIDTGNLASTYPTHVARRKDLVLMRQPHQYADLVAPAPAAER